MEHLFADRSSGILRSGANDEEAGGFLWRDAGGCVGETGSGFGEATAMSKNKQCEAVTYSDEERRRYLFRTADEMRVINEKAEHRTAKYAGAANAGTDVDETAVSR